MGMRSEISIPVLPFKRFTNAFNFGRIIRDTEHRDEWLMLIAVSLVVELPCAYDIPRGTAFWSSDFGDVLSGQLAVLHGVELTHVTRGASAPSVANNHPGRTCGNWCGKGQGGECCREKSFHRALETFSTVAYLTPRFHLLFGDISDG